MLTLDFIVPTLIVCLFIGTLYAYARPGLYFPMALAALSFALAGSCTGTALASDRASPLLLVALGYFFTLCAFAAVYTALYDANATAFCFSPSISEGKALNELSDMYRRVRSGNEMLYCLAAMEARYETAFEAVTKAVAERLPSDPTDAASGFVRLDDELYVRFLTQAAPLPLAGGTLVRGLEFWHAGRVSELGGEVPLSPEMSAVFSLGAARTRREFRQAVQSLASAVLQTRETGLRELKGAIDAKLRLTVLDFLYFSASTMTTVGYGDIVPSSRGVRGVVLLQLLVGVFYIAYALHLLTR